MSSLRERDKENGTGRSSDVKHEGDGVKSAGNKHLWQFYAQEAESRGRGAAFGKSTQVEYNESGVTQHPTPHNQVVHKK